MVVSECEPWDERKLQEIIQEFETGVKRVLISSRNYDLLLGRLTYYKPEKGSGPRVNGAQGVLSKRSLGQRGGAKILLEIIRRSDLMGASDIHLEPGDGYTRVRFRVHGNLLVQRKLAPRQAEEVMKALKLEAHLLNSQTGTFQSSRIRTELPHGKAIDLRVEVAPTVDGDSVVMQVAGLQEHQPEPGGPQSPGGLLSAADREHRQGKRPHHRHRTNRVRQNDDALHGSAALEREGCEGNNDRGPRRI